MTEYFINVGVMLLASTLFLWFRAVYSVAQKDRAYEWGVFFEENRNRIILQAAGCLLAAGVWMADPAGVASFFDRFGLEGFAGSRGAIGLAVGYISLWKQIT